MDALIYTAMSGAERTLHEQRVRANNLANLDTGGFRAGAQAGRGGVTGRVGIAGDIKTAQCRGKQQGGKVVGRERGHHRQGRQDHAQGQHGLDPFPGGHHVAGHAEADTVPEKKAHGPSR